MTYYLERKIDLVIKKETIPVPLVIKGRWDKERGFIWALVYHRDQLLTDRYYKELCIEAIAVAEKEYRAYCEDQIETREYEVKRLCGISAASR
jgi:hypothetical protein